MRNMHCVRLSAVCRCLVFDYHKIHIHDCTHEPRQAQQHTSSLPSGHCTPRKHLLPASKVAFSNPATTAAPPQHHHHHQNKAFALSPTPSDRADKIRDTSLVPSSRLLTCIYVLRLQPPTHHFLRCIFLIALSP